MSKYNRVAFLFIVAELLLFALCDFFAMKKYGAEANGQYKVDISRITSKMEAGEKINEIDLEMYSTVVSVKKFQPNQRSDYEYTVEEINGQLYRFEYFQKSDRKFLFLLNAMFGLIVMFTLMMLIYIKKKLIRPFNQMNYLTRELAKGNLSVPIKQEKSKYFKSFIWGMDMLREKLEDDKRRELELLKEKKTLILSLSHDIKTPLAAIDLYSKALKANLYESDDDRQNAIDGIEKNVSEIKRYVGEIAEASREEFLSLEVECQEIYLKKVLDEIDAFYEDKCKRLHIEFEVETFEDCLISGDFDRVVEVFQNIIENALKYGDGKNIRICVDEEEDCKLISICNTGSEIESEEILHIFDSFYRGSNSEKIEGSGLGLYICKELLKKMDGDIFARKSGGEFIVTVVLRKI